MQLIILNKHKKSARQAKLNFRFVKYALNFRNIKPSQMQNLFEKNEKEAYKRYLKISL